MKWRPYGRNAILIDFAEKPDDTALAKRLRIIETLTAKAPSQVVEFVPGFVNVLVEFTLAGTDTVEELAQRTIALLADHARDKVPLGPVKQIAVDYDGPDLPRVAEHNKISVEKVIKYHSETLYKVQLLGFSPGFPYLGELNPRLHTPRLPSPRPRVPAGSVAIGGQHTGVYTVESPGGWNIIGRTQLKIFDPGGLTAETEERAFFLKPGDRVKFVPIRA